MAEAGQVTALLVAIRSGDGAALDALFSVLYDELRVLARRQLSGAPHTLGTTGVVHEAYLKLVHGAQASAQDRAHFFALSARVMRQILVDHARARSTQKRGGGAVHVPLEDGHVPAAPEDAGVETLLALDVALDGLQQADPRLARLVELRFFVGLEVEECAEVMGVTARTLRRDWRKARAWLHTALAEPAA